jgi:hypothetical protein
VQELSPNPEHKYFYYWSFKEDEIAAILMLMIEDK